MTVAEWKLVVAAAGRFRTPFYLIWASPFREMLARITRLATSATPFRSWYSLKSQPVPRLALFAREQGLGIEVVSRYELYAAQRMGFEPHNILVNGVGKHTWLDRDATGLNVIFDSLYEASQLAKTAAERKWRCGLRLAVAQQKNADLPGYPVQFGMASQDAAAARDILHGLGVAVEILHFHLRSNVPAPSNYIEAINELSSIAILYSLEPTIVDIGGGLTEPPVEFVGRPMLGFSTEDYGQVIHHANRLFPSLSELWAENGRALLAPSAVLVTTIVDAKRVDGFQLLICDGGRTNHATPSEWERHFVDLASPSDWGTVENTVIHGPTCMAFDTIYQGPFPRDARIGDRVIYFDAGAYHLPWETRFSSGLCKVLWTLDGGNIEEIRAEESAAAWFGTWLAPEGNPGG